MGRSPDGFGGVSPENNSRHTERGGQVRNAGIVADECGADLNHPGQFGQREALRDLGARDGQGGSETLQAFAFGFAADEQQVQISGVDEMLQEVRPFCFGPIFLFTAAAGVQRDGGGRVRFLMFVAVGRRVEFKLRHVVGIENCEALEGPEVNLGGMHFFGFVWSMRADDELGGGAAGDVGFENIIGVVEIGEDDIEFGEIVREVLGEDSAPGEKTGEGARFDGLHAVDEAGGLGELDDVRVAEDFQVGVGKLTAQGGDRGQREDKISNRAAANHENFSASRLHEQNCALMEFRQAEDDHKKSEGEPDGRADADTLVIGGGPIQEIAKAPGGEREPDAGDDENVGPGLNHERPMGYFEHGPAAIDHQFCDEEKYDRQSANGDEILDENAGADADGGEQEAQSALVICEIGDGFLAQDPEKPDGGEEHEADADGDVAREFAHGNGEFLRFDQAIDLGQAHAEPNQNTEG
jgi:hypothetical protein